MTLHFLNDDGTPFTGTIEMTAEPSTEAVTVTSNRGRSYVIGDYQSEPQPADPVGVANALGLDSPLTFSDVWDFMESLDRRDNEFAERVIEEQAEQIATKGLDVAKCREALKFVRSELATSPWIERLSLYLGVDPDGDDENDKLFIVNPWHDVEAADRMRAWMDVLAERNLEPEPKPKVDWRKEGF